jgi:hypothetical protein
MVVPEDGTVAQRIIEMLIGRLITDEDFRAEFLENPEATLFGLSDRGVELSRAEIAAVLNTDRSAAPEGQPQVRGERPLIHVTFCQERAHV